MQLPENVAFSRVVEKFAKTYNAKGPGRATLDPVALRAFCGDECVAPESTVGSIVSGCEADDAHFFLRPVVVDALRLSAQPLAASSQAIVPASERSLGPKPLASLAAQVGTWTPISIAKPAPKACATPEPREKRASSQSAFSTGFLNAGPSERAKKNAAVVAARRENQAVAAAKLAATATAAVGRIHGEVIAADLGPLAPYFDESLQSVISTHGGLPSLSRALTRGCGATGSKGASEGARVCYLGGSITEQKGGWRPYVQEWLQKRAVETAVVEQPAFCGNAGSTLLSFLVRDWVVAQAPDVVFIEVAINDGDTLLETGDARKVARALEVRISPPSASIPPPAADSHLRGAGLRREWCERSERSAQTATYASSRCTCARIFRGRDDPGRWRGLIREGRRRRACITIRPSRSTWT